MEEPRGDQGVVTDQFVEEGPETGAPAPPPEDVDLGGPDLPASLEDLTQEQHDELVRMIQEAGPETSPHPPGSHSRPLEAAPTIATEATAEEQPADARTEAQSYVLNAGGEPKTSRVLDVDDEGKVSGVRIGRFVVRDDGALAFHELRPQARAQQNRAEIELLQRRLNELREEVR